MTALDVRAFACRGMIGHKWDAAASQRLALVGLHCSRCGIARSIRAFWGTPDAIRIWREATDSR